MCSETSYLSQFDQIYDEFFQKLGLFWSLVSPNYYLMRYYSNPDASWCFDKFRIPITNSYHIKLFF